MNVKKVFKYTTMVVLSLPLFVIFLFMVDIIPIAFFGASSARNAFPSTLTSNQCDILFILGDTYNKNEMDTKELRNDSIQEYIDDRGKYSQIYTYEFINNRIVVSYKLHLLEILYEKQYKLYYNIDYYINPNGKIIVYTYNVRNPKKVEKSILVTYTDKPISDSDWNEQTDLHRGEYMTQDELKTLIKKFSEKDKTANPTKD